MASKMATKNYYGSISQELYVIEQLNCGVYYMVSRYKEFEKHNFDIAWKSRSLIGQGHLKNWSYGLSAISRELINDKSIILMSKVV